MNVGDWVHASHNMIKITGFVIAIRGSEVDVQTTIPKNYGKITILSEQVIPSSETIWPDDIPSLIDISLFLRDRDWFNKWVYEQSLWRPINDVITQVP